jgi:hypothetical protein
MECPVSQRSDVLKTSVCSEEKKQNCSDNYLEHAIRMSTNEILRTLFDRHPNGGKERDGKIKSFNPETGISKRD